MPLLDSKFVLCPRKENSTTKRSHLRSPLVTFIKLITKQNTYYIKNKQYSNTKTTTNMYSELSNMKKYRKNEGNPNNLHKFIQYCESAKWRTMPLTTSLWLPPIRRPKSPTY